MIISEFERVVASLPRVSVLNCVGVDGDVVAMVSALHGPQELTNSAIMMYDPLPPLDSTCGYTRPERSNNTILILSFEVANVSIYISQGPSNSE